MHKLLQRQLKKACRRSGSDQPDIEYLLQQISDSYTEADNEHRLATHASELMERELKTAHHKAISESQNYFEAVLNQIGDGVLFLDQDNRITGCNERAESMLQQPLNELLSYNASALFNRFPDTDDAHESCQTNVIGNGLPVELIFRQVSYSEQEARLLIIRDIRDQLEAREQLAQSESRFRDYAESSSDWFWETDSKHRIISLTGFSPLMERINQSDLIGRSRMELMRHAPPDVFERHIDDLNAHRPFRDLEYELDLKDGRCLISVSGKPRFDPQNRFIGYRGTAKDITAMRRTDEHLKAVERQLRIALDSINEGIALFDEQDNLVLFNDRILELYAPISDLIYPGAAYATLAGALVERQVLDLSEVSQDWLKHKISRETRYQVSQHTTKTSDGRFIRALEYPTADGGTVGIYSDVSETQQLQQHLVSEKERAEAASQAKSEFLANMSHEIRTPMNAIIGLAGLALMEQELSPTHREYIEKIQRSSRHLLGLLNDILDFSKIEAGKLEISGQPFMFSELIEQINTLTQPMLKDNPLQLNWQIADDIPIQLYGDLMRIVQIMTNLVSNAFKFTPKGMITLRFQCQALSESDGEPPQQYTDIAIPVRLSISVEDTGIGISETQMSRLFSAFTQADASITRNYGGTGLGLAISRQLSQMMGGDLSAQSRIQQGSCFSFSVLLWAISTSCYQPPKTQQPVSRCPADSHANNIHTVNEPANMTEVSPDSGSDNTQPILLVEDNSINQMVAGRFLSKIGIAFDIADNGEQALSLLQQKNYAVVLMDLQMPVMDGLTATREIRRQPQWTSLPIIAMTANAMQGDKERCLDAGMDDYISKPIDFMELKAKLERWLGE